MQRVIQVYTNQKKDVPLFTEQLRRWQAGDITNAQCEEIEHLTGQMSRLQEVIDAILTLADELKQGTIEKMMSKSDAELGLETLLKMMERKP